MEKANSQLKQWIDAWSRAGTEMERIRIIEMRESNTYESMRALSDAFDSAISDFNPSQTSGLVEQQKYFMLLRKNVSSN